MDYSGLHNALQALYGSTSFLLVIGQQRLVDRIGPTDWAVPMLAEFWGYYDRARQILDSIPATQDIAAPPTSSWKLATRQTLDAIADTLRSTAILVNSDGDTQDVLAQWPTIVKGFESVAVSRWPELLPEPERLMIAMEESLSPEDLFNHRVGKLSAALGNLHYSTLCAVGYLLSFKIKTFLKLS